ncbi:GNAT family N-acetyltransferase [Saccharopolyspora montiporae]|nr:GNAT family N-acetyltransferase [Saccharopolyspora sp. HNM0983]
MERELWRLRAAVADAPGRLAQLAGNLAALGGDIRTMHVHPMPDGVVDEVLLHLPAEVTEAQLVGAVRAAGGTEIRALRADVRELDDVPTRTVKLADDLINGRAEVVGALQRLLGDVEVVWQESPQPDPGAEFAAEVIRLPEPGGGLLEVRRPGASFTPAEFARASSMLEFAASCRRLVPTRIDRARTRDGCRVTVRAATRADLDLVCAFHDRCSGAARYRRYFGPGPGPGEQGLRRLLTPALGRCLLVLSPDGEIVGMGNLMYQDDSGEVALLVRDDWQRRGVGTILVRGLVEKARELGIAQLTAQTHVDNTAIARTLRTAGLKLAGAPEPGEWSWSLDLRAKAGARG